jgi:hypothetical protein
MPSQKFWTCMYDSCNMYLDDPIVLPCYTTICKHHVNDEMVVSQETGVFKCKQCGKKHVVPEDGFKSDVVIKRVIDLNLHLSDKKHKDAKQVFEEIDQTLNSVEAKSITDPEVFLSSFFTNLKNEVNLHRTNMIKQIDDKLNEMMERLKEFETECKENQSNIPSFDLNNFKKKFMLKWKESLRKPGIELPKLQDLVLEMNSNLKYIQKRIESNKKELLLNNACEFEPIYDDIQFGQIFFVSLPNSSLEEPTIKIEDELEEVTCINPKEVDEQDDFGISNKVFKGHYDRITCVKIIKESKILISSSFDYSIKIWSIESGINLA